MHYLHLLIYCQYCTAFCLGMLGIIPWIHSPGARMQSWHMKFLGWGWLGFLKDTCVTLPVVTGILGAG